MKILLIDDSISVRQIVTTYLSEAGINDVVQASSANEALTILNSDDVSEYGFDLILVDIVMADMDGIQLTKTIKSMTKLNDIPVIIITSSDDIKNLQAAFDAGAQDFISKSFHKIEMIARIKSALLLKQEMDRRKKREQELLEREKDLMEINRLLEVANQSYLKNAAIDSLTEILNRRYFDEFLQLEWKKAVDKRQVISVIMIDIDHFKNYNDTYGHQSGDQCLREVAQTLKNTLTRQQDILARYGGEEFTALLPGMNNVDCLGVAENLRLNVEKLNIKHEDSSTAGHVTISLGVSSMVPTAGSMAAGLIEKADKNLYSAKNAGRNRVI